MEKLEGNGRTGVSNAIDPRSKWKRLEREKHWMLKMRTVYPVGMNEKVGDEWKRDEKNITPVSAKFPKLSQTSPRLTRGNGLNKENNPVAFLDALKQHLDNNIKESMNFLRSSLFSFSKKNTLKTIYSTLEEFLDDNSDPYIQWYLAAQDIITARIYKEPVNPPKKKVDPQNNIKLTFMNKGIEMINLSKILHSP